MGPLCRREGALSFNCNVLLLGGTPALAFPKIDLLVLTDVLSAFTTFSLRPVQELFLRAPNFMCQAGGIYGMLF